MFSNNKFSYQKEQRKYFFTVSVLEPFFHKRPCCLASTCSATLIHFPDLRVYFLVFLAQYRTHCNSHIIKLLQWMLFIHLFIYFDIRSEQNSVQLAFPFSLVFEFCTSYVDCKVSFQLLSTNTKQVEFKQVVSTKWQIAK